MTVKGKVLSGSLVRLEPLSLAHLPGLWEAGQYPELWRWTQAAIRTPDDLRSYVETALSWQDQGTALPFATVLRNTGRVVGSTRFANMDEPNLRAEIGWTWVTPELQKSGVNVEAKYLMLRYAFETLKLNRVEFKTDSLNEKSRGALRALGAVEEGTFRNHMVVADGRIRHSVYYSITKEEWPQVREALMRRLARAAPAATP